MCKILYKYRTITDDDRNDGANPFTRNLITKGELYFPRFSELNDPNEAIFDYSDHVDIEVSKEQLSNFPNHIYVQLLPNGRNHIQVDGRAAALRVRSMIDQMYGILCLTKNNTSSLMFDYYANGHSGICIGFEWRKFGLIRKDNQQHQEPEIISYNEKPPVISPSGADNFDKVFSTKWREYIHEQEYRLTYTPGIFPDTKKIMAAIKEIIFGCATSEVDKDLVRKWISQAGLEVSYYEAHLKPNSYDIILNVC